MEITAQMLCQFLNGELEGNPNITVNRPAKIEEGEAGTICFLANLKYEPYVYTTKASILLVERTFQPKQPITATLIRVADVRQSMQQLLKQFNPTPTSTGKIDRLAFVHPKAKLHQTVEVAAFAYLKQCTIGANTIIHQQVFIGDNVTIGENVILHTGVKILQGCNIGNNCVIHPNTVIGSDGFGFVPDKNGVYAKVPQTGNVEIKDNVEIGANTVVDRATMGSTIIQKGVKLDNLIQIAHNVEIGENTVIAAQVGIAGSTKVGKNCMIGGQVGIVGHITIADGSKIQAQSGIARSLKKEGQAWYGSPAFNYNDFLRSHILFQKLPKLTKRIKALEKRLKELES